MGCSLFGEGLLTTYLPDAPWRPLVASFGYCFGFLVVVLGRQQLFTENTLTPILPLLQHRTWSTLVKVARLGAIVLVANLIGAACIALIAADSTAFDPAVRRTFAAIGQSELEYGFATARLRGVFAGRLLALMVWLMPFAETGRIWVIVVVTYLVGLGKSATSSPARWPPSPGPRRKAATGGAVLVHFSIPCVIGNHWRHPARRRAQPRAGGGRQPVRAGLTGFPSAIRESPSFAQDAAPRTMTRNGPGRKGRAPCPPLISAGTQQESSRGRFPFTHRQR